MKRIIYIIVGCIFVSIGALGVFIPVLPTTIFLILASYLFVRSSPKLHSKLLNHKAFGQLIKNFVDHRGITKKHRNKSLITLWFVLIISILLIHKMIFVLILIIVGIAHTIFFFKLRLLEYS